MRFWGVSKFDNLCLSC